MITARNAPTRSPATRYPEVRRATSSQELDPALRCPRLLRGLVAAVTLGLVGGLGSPALEAQPSPAWENTGPLCERVESYAGDPTQGELSFLATVFQGLYRSHDDGRSWQPLRKDLPSPGQGVVAFDPAHPEWVYYTTFHDGTFSSNDGGDTWQRIGQDAGVVGHLVVPPGMPGTVFLDSYRSFDGGESVIDVLPGPGADRFAGHPRHPERLWAHSLSRVYFSTDLGDTWVETQPLPGGSVFARLTVVPDLADVAYIADFNQLYRVEVDTLTFVGEMPRVSTVSRPPDLLALPDNTLLLATGRPHGADDEPVLRSTDGGLTWSPVPLRGEEVNQLLWIDGARRIVALADSGVFVSDDLGETWRALEQGVGSADVPALVLAGPHRSTLIAAAADCTQLHMARSPDGGRTWQKGSPLPVLRAYDLVVDTQDPRWIYATTGDSQVLRSRDLGKTWESFSTPGSPFSLVESIAIHPVDPLLLVSFRGAGLARSLDRGETWEPLPLPADFESVGSVVFDPIDPDRIFLGFDEHGVARSDDGGQTWQRFGQELGNTFLEQLYIHPEKPETVFLSTLFSTPSLYRSRDAGETWDFVPGPFEEAQLKDLAFDPNDPDRLVATTPDELFTSLDGGDTWAPLGVSVPPRVDLGPLVVHPSGDIHVGTRRHGVFNVSPCRRDARHACLLGGRFQVSGTMRDFAEPPNPFPTRVMSFDQGLAKTDQIALFESFVPGSLEIAVKLIDGCQLPAGDPRRAFWTFFGGLTNAQATVQVVDTVSQEIVRWENPAGQFAQTFGDTRAFSCVDGPPVSACTADAETACLLDGRFRVTVTMQDFSTPPRRVNGRVIELGSTRAETPESVFFESFQLGAFEVGVKMLDACSLPEGHPQRAYWAFYGGLSNAETQLEVQQRSTALVDTWTNAAGSFPRSEGRVQAFPCEE